MMYAVIRFISQEVPWEVFEHIGSELNAVIPGACSGPRVAGDGFACELSRADSWENHRVAILEFVRIGRSAISKARQQSIDVWIDVAVEPEDIAGRNLFCIHVDLELARSLTEAGVGFEVSVYGGVPTDGGGK